MLKLHAALRLILPLVLLAALAGCASATPPPSTLQPTPDANAIRTQAAVTIFAQLTASAPPTSTLPPTTTSTPLPPTTTLTLTASTTASPTSGTPVPSSTPTVSPTTPIVGDAARCAGTAPHSGVEIRPNETYNLEFDLLNIGTTIWTPGYRLMYVGGERFTNVTVIQLDREVLPGKKGVFILGTFGSEEMNPHYTYWQLYNDRGLAVEGGYCEFWYQPV